MKNKAHSMHEPLVHITKRPETTFLRSCVVRIIAVLLALGVCSLIIVLLADCSPLDVFREVFKGAWGSKIKTFSTLQETAMLLCIALAVTPAFKMRFWNLGAEGQVLIGGLASAACMILFGSKLKNPALIALMVVVSIAASALWALIPAFFKARWNTNETLFTLMMNYVAMQLVAFFEVFWENPKDSAHIGIINFLSRKGWLPTLFGRDYIFNIIVVAVVTVLMFVYLRYSKHGYEISVVGESENTAKYIGINVKKVILRTAALSGAICGIAGLLLVAGANHTITPNTAGGRGFTAVMVSWLAKFNPLVMVITSLLLVFLQKGAGQLATKIPVLNLNLSDVLTGVILFFIIGCEFFINYKLNFRKRKSREAA